MQELCGMLRENEACGTCMTMENEVFQGSMRMEMEVEMKKLLATWKVELERHVWGISMALHVMLGTLVILW